jgi:3-phenylpropionate/cinnamic acid dioxygenase small subunit
MDDSRQIENLLYRYAQRIDAGDFEGVAELFSHGCICAAGADPVQGYEAVLQLYRSSTRLYDNGTPCTRHITSNPLIEVDGDRATCHSYFTVMQALPDFPLQPIISGHYEDQLQRLDGRWTFLCRTMFPELFGDLSRHLLFDLPPPD